MDDMDIDHVDVPDTPDRLTAQHRSHTNGKECESSIVRFLESPDIANREHGFVPRGDVRVVNRIGPAKRPYMRPPKRISNPNGYVNCSDTIIISSSEKSEPSHSLISQRARTYQNAEHDHGCYSAVLDMDAGMESRSSACPVDGAAMMNLKDRTASNTACQTTLLYGESKKFLNDQFRQAETETHGNNSRHPPVPFQRLSKSSKGKEKVDESTRRGTGTMSHGKEIDLSDASHGNKKNNESPKTVLELPRNISSAGLAGQKRLVRNGCISPHNITRKVKETAGENRNSFKNSGLCEVHREVSSISSPQTELKEIVAEDDSSGRNKGKGILLHPCTSREYEASAVHTSGRNSIITGVENRGNCDASVDVVDCYERQGDWRSTGNRVNSIHCSGPAAAIGLSRRSTGADSSAQMREIIAEKRSRFYDNKISGSDTPEDKSAYHATSSQPHCAGAVMKKQRGRGSTSRNDSRLGSSESEVVLLGSSENSPDLSPVGFSSRQQRGTLDTVIEIDEFSPDIRQSGTSQVGPTNSYDSDARARQMEADEMLARELQEQLYNESPIDEYVAHMLQGEEQNRTTRTSVGRPRPLVARNSSLMSSRRQPEQELHQSLSSSRRRSRINTSLRSQQSRGRSSRRSSSLSGGRGLQFPSHMDLDMRIDVLEALEAALGDVDDLGLSSSIFHIQRDFNENDYEMLLSLDDSIRQAGASSTQINNLPESKVQTNCEEPCAICLENPTIGEMIRHLPCLHKFHKECIDPWLSRSTSCPVCKSSIS